MAKQDTVTYTQTLSSEWWPTGTKNSGDASVVLVYKKANKNQNINLVSPSSAKISYADDSATISDTVNFKKNPNKTYTISASVKYGETTDYEKLYNVNISKSLSTNNNYTISDDTKELYKYDTSISNVEILGMDDLDNPVYIDLETYENPEVTLSSHYADSSIITDSLSDNIHTLEYKISAQDTSVDNKIITFYSRNMPISLNQYGISNNDYDSKNTVISNNDSIKCGRVEEDVQLDVKYNAIKIHLSNVYDKTLDTPKLILRYNDGEKIIKISDIFDNEIIQVDANKPTIIFKENSEETQNLYNMTFYIFGFDFSNDDYNPIDCDIIYNEDSEYVVHQYIHIVFDYTNLISRVKDLVKTSFNTNNITIHPNFDESQISTVTTIAQYKDASYYVLDLCQFVEQYYTIASKEGLSEFKIILDLEDNTGCDYDVVLDKLTINRDDIYNDIITNKYINKISERSIAITINDNLLYNLSKNSKYVYETTSYIDLIVFDIEAQPISGQYYQKIDYIEPINLRLILKK